MIQINRQPSRRQLRQFAGIWFPAFWALVGLQKTMTGAEFEKLTDMYAKSRHVFERSSYDGGFRTILKSDKVALDRMTHVRVLDERYVLPDDGDLLVTVTAGQDKNGLPIDLLPWLYAFGPGVEVLAPERVREHVRRELRDAADAYDH